jgi:cytochrome c oxidase subunit 2
MRSAVVLAAIFAVSCGPGNQSVIDPAGVQAERLGSLWWVFFGICAAVYVLVTAAVLIAFFKRERSDSQTAPELAPDPGREKRISNVIKACVGVTLLTLFALMITSFRTGRAVYSLSNAAEPLVIKVTGQQWWWDVEYQGPNPSQNIRTANEIHVPVGRPVKLLLQSNDVIHSFWLPNMHGKKDLVPNYPTTFFFQADKPGEYWGQCAEFCGYQHAKMRFFVTAESPGQFEAWYAAQQNHAALPSTDSQQKGQNIFLTSVCTQCHTVAGTPAAARVGPDLTHIATRPYIAAGSLQNTRDNLERWVTDPHSFKPGIRMPMNPYSDDDLRALVDYLEILK